MGRLRAFWGNRRKRWATIGVVVVLYMFINGRIAKIPVVQVATARTDALKLTIAASGKVDGDAADLAFGETGTVSHLYVVEGQRVEAHQVLARMRRTSGSSALGVESGADAEVIEAPTAGSVVQIYRHEGSAVQPGLPVLRVVSADSVGIVAYLDSEDAGWLRLGHRLVARAGGYLARPWDLQVEAIGREAVQREDVPGSSRQVRVRLRILSSGFDLPVGSAVDVDGEIPMVDKALLVPAGAISKTRGKTYVWQLNAGHLRRVEVRTGPTNLRHISVLTGLAEGNEVVVESGAGAGMMGAKAELKDGQYVRRTVWPGEGQL
ncbi:MAG: HlyD family efflux transporter periplasmic adaptor subunit [Armatimonadetes bacterium]|nr:HlyD family efflux transporter periplasmic adaptor subunit [Armatimonadota bacterium]